MKKYLMVIADYPDQRQDFYHIHMSPRNKEYARKFGYEFLEYTDGLVPFRETSNKGKNWLKFTFIQEMISTGFLKEGDVITHIDADMVISKNDVEFPCNKSYNYTIDSGNTHNTGLFSIRVNEWSTKMLDLILDQDRYDALNDVVSLHERFGFINSFWHDFREQASWYSLAGIKRHSDIPFYNLAHYGWHSDKNEWTVYSLEELYEHVEILPTCWNVTEMPGESWCEFNINQVERKDVIIRHFAGGQPWRDDY